MNKKKNLVFFLIIILLVNCSFDTKTGIWTGEKTEKKRIVELEKEQIDIDLNSNKASEARFVWAKKLMKKTGFWRVILKSLIPSLKIRQIIKNSLQRANTNEYIPKALSQTDKKAIFETYFKQDVVALEKLIDRKMNWNL